MAAQHQSGEGGVCIDVTVKVQKMEILEYMHSRLCYPEPGGWVFCKFLGRGCADGTLTETINPYQTMLSYILCRHQKILPYPRLAIECPSLL